MMETGSVAAMQPNITRVPRGQTRAMLLADLECIDNVHASSDGVFA